MLTGWETVPAAFVATAWQQRAVWGALLDDVRLVTLGLVAAGVGPGDAVRAGDLTAELAVLAAGGVAVLDGSAGADLPSGDLRAAGRSLDEHEPDAFERSWRAIEPDAPAIVAGATFTHANVVAAVRSLALATGAGPGRRVQVDLPVTAPGAHLLAPLTGATTGPGDIVLGPDRARVVTGHAGVVALDGVPLPGVVVSGTRLRSDAVAPGALVDGWLGAA
ncbi:MAG: hypothetical protein JWN67_2566 [Actinomycetia bacterium]|nr:hypothetical protein [Actinomycetes bacterium]